ncbi:T9SS type A sorting domain-containing protein [Croceimicrobium hydrocarbonivorans]|uniref:T9SS type A sorting domain-containing protein n=1 Tax=Croceimicrobium hydrocarbonivorans TaxID=2761580 RepID=A0A7H0VB32_9FLAO|nr:T9SS type A sorting domain-containing protein [Croceimicrobium hydrocarbonivorans]QNR22930.1 T9SS type A sorting domain-containing protein [Croceimicrobium hydrocarbonivorans]
MKSYRIQRALLAFSIILSPSIFAQGTSSESKTKNESSFYIQKNTDAPGLYKVDGQSNTRILVADNFYTVESVLKSAGRLYVLRLNVALAKTEVIFSDDQGKSWQNLELLDRLLDQLEINSANELIAYNSARMEDEELILSAAQLALKETESLLRIYPNPVDHYLKIEHQFADLKPGDIQLYSSLGQSMKLNINEENQCFTLDVSQLSPGMYYINIQLEERLISRSIVIK